jgi:hypothetical protein
MFYLISKQQLDDICHALNVARGNLSPVIDTVQYAQDKSVYEKAHIALAYAYNQPVKIKIKGEDHVA